MDTVVDRLIRYAKVYSESDYHAGRAVTPSTQRQFDMGRLLVEELHGLGIENAVLDEKCYVYASVPASPGCEHLPAIGLIAHMDTTPDMTGKDVKPQVIHYEGGDVVLNREKGIVMEAAQFPELQKFVGQDLVCSDGTTLLGADDKAGIAMILQAVEELLAEGVPHGKICIGFTPDEEIGMGASGFDVKGFGADVAYTIDGGTLGELEYENFNAASGKVFVHGRGSHPGSAKNAMKNASLMAMEFHSLLPAEQNPMYTEGYEGFFHLGEIKGDMVEAQLDYIIRDHDRQKFEEKKALFAAAGEFLNAKYGQGTVEVQIKDSYYNMKELIEPHMYLIDIARTAMERMGVTPQVVPIRGGTDGARLSYMGLPCPNLCTGGANYHGIHEYACVQSMEKVVEILIEIVKIFGNETP